MSKEIPLQQDMFSEALVDTRSDYRKRQDRQRDKPRQAELFSVQETVQVGVNPRPWLKTMAAPTLILEMQDVRTEEEKDRDWWREAHKQIAPMFDETQETNGHAQADTTQPGEIAAVEPKVVYEAPNLRHVGYRADARRRCIPVRWGGSHDLCPATNST